MPYANGEIHLGHIASTYLPADIFTRFIKLTNSQIYHICATDDFGTPILIKSEKENKTPQEYVKIWNEKDKKDIVLFLKTLTDTSAVKNVPNRLPGLGEKYAALNKRKIGGEY